MEELAFKILSEQWIIALLLFVVIYFVVKNMKWWIEQHLKLQSDHNERFLGRLDSIILGNKQHTEEHSHIVKTMEKIDANVQTNTSIMKVLHEGVKVVLEDVKTLHAKL